MKNSGLYIPKYDLSKKKSHAIEVKKKIISNSNEKLLPFDSNSRKELRAQSNSKTNSNSIQINFSKSFLVNNKVSRKQFSHQRVKSSSSKGATHRQYKDNLSPYIKDYKSSNNISKMQHYHSLDKELSKRQSSEASKKSYLIDYLNNKSGIPKNQADTKFDRRKKEAQPKSERKPPSVIMNFAFRTRQGTLITNPSKPNQDSLLVQNNGEGKNIFAVADGHGTHGHFVSQKIIKSLQKYLLQELSKNKVTENTFIDIFTKIQTELYQTKDFNANISGSTLISVLIDAEYKLMCANVGDSRAILARQIDKKNWEIIHLSQDHKPNIQKQKKRILKKGGKIHCFKDENGQAIGPLRVWLPNQNMQGLAMSRSMGDNVSKPIGVTHEPEVVNLQIQQSDRFILIASDGVWQFIKNFEILQLVVPFYKQNKIEECCDALMKLAYERWTVEDTNVIDDITLILIFLLPDQ